MVGTFQEWLDAHPPPSLVELIAQYGSYDAIPAEEWTAFADAQVEWEKRRKARAAQEAPSQLTQA